MTKAVVSGTYRTARIRYGTRSSLHMVVTMLRFVRNGNITGFNVKTVRQ